MSKRFRVYETEQEVNAYDTGYQDGQEDAAYTDADLEAAEADGYKNGYNEAMNEKEDDLITDANAKYLLEYFGLHGTHWLEIIRGALSGNKYSAVELVVKLKKMSKV